MCPSLTHVSNIVVHNGLHEMKTFVNLKGTLYFSRVYDQKDKRLERPSHKYEWIVQISFGWYPKCKFDYNFISLRIEKIIILKISVATGRHIPKRIRSNKNYSPSYTWF
jgi:hypothetical protein